MNHKNKSKTTPQTLCFCFHVPTLPGPTGTPTGRDPIDRSRSCLQVTAGSISRADAWHQLAERSPGVVLSVGAVRRPPRRFVFGVWCFWFCGLKRWEKWLVFLKSWRYESGLEVVTAAHRSLLKALALCWKWLWSPQKKVPFLGISYGELLWVLIF